VTHVTPPQTAQKEVKVHARHKSDCLPGSKLACVGLASQLEGAAGVCASLLQASSQSCQQLDGQLGGAAGVSASHLQASSQSCQQLDGQLGSAAGVSASLLQASSQSCQQLGAQVPMLPPTPRACRHKATSKDLQMQDRGQLGTALAEAKSTDGMTEVRRLKALLCALLGMPGSFRATGAGACTAPRCTAPQRCSTYSNVYSALDERPMLGHTYHHRFSIDAQDNLAVQNVCA